MTIDFTLTPELEELRLRIRDFVELEVKPVEAELKDPDRIEDRKDYIEKLIAMRAKAQEAGIWLPHMPKEWGGMGLGHVELAMVQAEAAKSYYGPFSVTLVVARGLGSYGPCPSWTTSFVPAPGRAEPAGVA